MHKVYLFSLLCVTILLTEGYGQKKSYLGFHVTAAHSFRNLNGKNSDLGDIFINYLDSREKSSSGTSIGLFMETQLTRKFYSSIGVDLTKLRWDIMYDYRHTDYAIYEYAGLPITGKYFVGLGQRFSLGIALCARIDFLTGHREYEADRPDEYWTYRNVALCGSVSTVLEYSLNRFSLFVTPLYSRYLTSNATFNFHDDVGIFNESDVKIRQYNYYYGVSFGSKYKLSKE